MKNWFWHAIFPVKPLGFFDSVLTSHFGNMLFGDPQHKYDAAGDASWQAWQAASRGISLEEQKFAMQKEEYEAQRPLRAGRLGAAERQVPRDEAEDIRMQQLSGEVIDEAKRTGSAEEQEAAASRAMASTAEAFDAGEASRERTLRSLGLAKPGDAAYTAGARAADIARAGSLAKAGTDARETERNKGFERRLRVAGQRRGFNPNVQMQAAPGAGAMFQGSSALTSVAGTQLNIGKARVALDMAQREATGQTLDELGEAAGSWFSMGMKEGGPVRRLRYATGGEVKGPGGPKEDAVPATIDGKPGAALSSGEYVIKADSVAKYGPRLLREVNDGTAIIVPTMSPRRMSQAGGA